MKKIYLRGRRNEISMRNRYSKEKWKYKLIRIHSKENPPLAACGGLKGL